MDFGSVFTMSFDVLVLNSCLSGHLLECHVGGDFHQFASHGFADGIAVHSTVGEGTVGGLCELDVLGVRPDVIAEAQQGFLAFHLVRDKHPSTVDISVHISVHLSEKTESGCSQRGFIEVEIDVRACILAEEVAGKRMVFRGRLVALRLYLGKAQDEAD